MNGSNANGITARMMPMTSGRASGLAFIRCISGFCLFDREARAARGVVRVRDVIDALLEPEASPRSERPGNSWDF
jgi:hypothetical protein